MGLTCTRPARPLLKVSGWAPLSGARNNIGSFAARMQAEVEPLSYLSRVGSDAMPKVGRATPCRARIASPALGDGGLQIQACPLGERRVGTAQLETV